jgi:hypothetical protein
VRYTPGHHVGSTLQIIDMATGATTLVPPVPCVLPDESVGGQPGSHKDEGFPERGTIGLVRGQGLRISLTHHEHTPPSQQIPPICNIVADVFDVGGKLSIHVRHTPGHPIGAQAQIVDISSGVTLGAYVPCVVPDPSL